MFGVPSKFAILIITERNKGDRMRKIELILTDSEAVIANDPVYIEAGEDVEFVITNPVGKLYFLRVTKT